MGPASSTVYYNLKLRHPTLYMPIIDYDFGIASPTNAYAQDQHRSYIQRDFS